MASPQVENGYTKIANELYEKIYSTEFLASEFRILSCIIRKTYGWNKKEDRISLSQFILETKLSKQTVVTALKTLVANKVIIKNNFVFSVNKGYSKWGSQTDLTSQADLTRTSQAHWTKIGLADLTHKRKKEKKEISTSSKEEDAPLKVNNKKTMRKNRIGSYNENNNSDNYEDSIDIDTGEFSKPKEPKRQKAINYIKEYFISKCEKEIKIKPILGLKQNSIIANLFNKNKMKPSDITDVIDWWFETEQDKTKLIQMSYCLSAWNINKFKVAKEL